MIKRFKSSDVCFNMMDGATPLFELKDFLVLLYLNIASNDTSNIIISHRAIFIDHSPRSCRLSTKQKWFL